MNIRNLAGAFTIAVLIANLQYAASADGPVKRKETTGPLFPFQKDGLWGLIDTAGDVVFEPQFSSELSEPRFSNGHAVVMLKGRKMYLTENGETIVPPDNVSVLGGFANGLFRVNVGQQIRMGDILANAGLWGFMNEKGKLVIKPGFSSVGVFSERLATAAERQLDEPRPKWGYIDTNGDWAIKPKFVQARAFSEGLAFVGVVVSGERFVKQGVIDKKGTLVVKPQFDQANSFHLGRAAVKKDGKWAYIDKMGTPVCKFEYDAAEQMNDGLGLVWKWDKNKKGQIVNARCGFMNNDGTLLTKLSFTSGYNFSNGMAAVQVDGKYGFVDRTGRLAIKASFASVGAFNEELAAVQVDGKYGYINKSGEMVIEPRFDFGQPFSGGLARVFLNREKKEHGYINKQGKLVMRFQLQPRQPRF